MNDFNKFWAEIKHHSNSHRIKFVNIFDKTMYRTINLVPKYYFFIIISKT